MKTKLLLTLPFILTSCSNNNFKSENISVMVEQGEDYAALTPLIQIKRGENATFELNIKNNVLIYEVSYEDWEVSYSETIAYLTLKNVYYPQVISIKTTTEYVTVDSNSGNIINSEDSTYSFPLYREHKRVNTPVDDNLYKSGYQLYGYKENLNDTDSIPIGSKFSRETKTLYADFKKETSLTNLSYYKNSDGSITLSSYLGNEKEVILPSYIDDIKVTKIDNSCFVNKNIDLLFIPKTIYKIEDTAFLECNIKTVALFDNLKGIKDNCFSNCTIEKLRINAAGRPNYMTTYYALFSDKVDLLIEKQNSKKLVLFSGSTTRYGYDCYYFKEAYPLYEPINMGVFAYTNQSTQLEIIEHFLQDDDVLLVSPEYDYNAFDLQFFIDKKMNNVFYRMVEADYQLFSYINIQNYTEVFDSFSSYVSEKSTLPTNLYSQSPQFFDDDGNSYSIRIYNQYMDFSLERYGTVEEGRIFQPEIDYTTKRFTDEVFASYNNFYKNYTEKNIKILFTYAPRNIDSLTVESTLENRQALENLIESKIQLPVISKMEDFFYKAIDFYLIDDHLTSEGAIKRTKKVIEDLKDYL